MEVKLQDGKIKDVSLLEVTPENYIVPRGEENAYHCRIEIVKFNQDTGKRISKPRIQKFGKKFFETFGLEELKRQGYKVDVLHDPNEWLNAEKEMQEKQEQAEIEAAAAAEEERKKAEREALKAEIRAELKDEIRAELEAEAENAADDAPKKRGRKPKVEDPEPAQDGTDPA